MTTVYFGCQKGAGNGSGSSFSLDGSITNCNANGIVTLIYIRSNEMRHHMIKIAIQKNLQLTWLWDFEEQLLEVFYSKSNHFVTHVKIKQIMYIHLSTTCRLYWCDRRAPKYRHIQYHRLSSTNLDNHYKSAQTKWNTLQKLRVNNFCVQTSQKFAYINLDKCIKKTERMMWPRLNPKNTKVLLLLAK